MSTKFTILGCGSSLGIPRIDGYFGNCNPKIKKNYRTRCCALISHEKKNILIDTSPDIKSQLLRQKIKNIDEVFYTHMHGDQTHGINELRVYYLKNRKRINVYADKDTKEYLKKSFTYCFKGNFGYPPIMKINTLKKKHKYDKLLIEAFPVEHGKVNSILYLINKKCAYASDVSRINKRILENIKKIKYFIIDCLRFEPHPSHFCLDEVLEIHSFIKPKKTILTNLNNEMDYKQLKRKLPSNVIPAYDGMTLKI